MKKKKINSGRILLFVFAGVLSLAFVGPGAYALYQNSYDVEVITRTGELICDVSVETNEDYIENDMIFQLKRNIENRDLSVISNLQSLDEILQNRFS